MVYNLKGTSEDYRTVGKAAYIRHTKDWDCEMEGCYGAMHSGFLCITWRKKKADWAALYLDIYWLLPD